MTLPLLRSLGLAALLALAAAAPAMAQTPTRDITQIAGNLYRFQNNAHYSVFLVTPEGVIVTDPINAEAAAWLRDEIATRFGQPIRYLIYSHDHADHSSGGEVFAAAGAVVVAHENAKTTIIAEARPTAVPQITFSDRLTLELGGESVELLYVGRSHSDNSVAMLFPAERTLFAVDIVSVRSLPFRNLSDSWFPDWIEALALLEDLDFDILAPGHGALGAKQDLTDHRRYLEELYTAVLSAARAGQTLEEMQAGIRLEAYRDWAQYEAWLPLNVEGMYRQISLHRRGN